MTATNGNGFEVQTLLETGWSNTFRNDEGEPITFSSMRKASTYLDALKQAAPSKTEYRVYEVLEETT